MASPTLNQVHVNRPLSTISQAYMQDTADYVADQIFSVVPVQKQSDRYFVYKKGDWFRDEAQLRGPATESAGGGYEIDNTPSYYAPVYAFHKDVDEQVRSNSDDSLNADRDATLFITQRLLLKREILVTNIALAASTWTGSTTAGDITPATKWDLANSTPLEDIETQVWGVKQVTGKFCNRLYLGSHAWKALKNHDEILQRIRYTEKGIVTSDVIASLVAPPRVNDFQVIVQAAIKNTAQAGATDSFSFIGPMKDALLFYRESNTGIMVPSAGYVFTWVGLMGAGALGTRISSIPAPLLGQGTVRIEGELAFAAKVVGADLGAYFLNAVSA